MAMNTEELACVYATLMLLDDEAQVTPAALQAVISAAGLKIKPFWFRLFSKFADGKRVEDLVGSFSAAPAASSSAPVAGASKASAAPAEKEPEPESDEEDDADMGFSLFD